MSAETASYPHKRDELAKFASAGLSVGSLPQHERQMHVPRWRHPKNAA